MRSEEACTAISAVAERIEASAGPLENAGQRAEAAGGRAEQATDALMSSLSSAAARAEERARAADKRAAQLLERAKDAAEEAVQGASRACERVGKVTDTLALHSTRLAGETVRLSEAVGDCTAVLAEVRTENSRLAGEAGQLGDYNQALRKGAGRLQQAIQFAEACLSRENVSRSIPTELSENLSRVSSASATSLAAAQGQELYSSVPSSSSASSLWRRSLSSAPTQCQLDVAGPPSRVLPPVGGAALRIELPPTSPIAPRGGESCRQRGRLPGNLPGLQCCAATCFGASSTKGSGVSSLFSGSECEFADSKILRYIGRPCCRAAAIGFHFSTSGCKVPIPPTTARPSKLQVLTTEWSRSDGEGREPLPPRAAKRDNRISSTGNIDFLPLEQRRVEPRS